MRIGQLATSVGITVQAIRFYERQGLIRAPARRDSGYREFSESAVDEIRKVLQLKALGFTIAEIRAALGKHSEDGEVCRIAAEKVHALKAEIRRLSEVLKAVEETRRVCGCEPQPQFQSFQVLHK